MKSLYSRSEWLGNLRGDILAGLVVALALIPEAIAFSIIAGVDPKVGLYASFFIATVSAFAGGRPAMISAATAAIALLVKPLVTQYGLSYLLAATLLAGVLQIIAGYLQLAKLMSFVSRSVITGFVNALAILIFVAQLPELTNVTWHVYALTAISLLVIYLFPYVPVVGRLLPSPLIAIISVTLLTVFTGIEVRTVGQMGTLPDALPFFALPQFPLTPDTLSIIFPYAAAMAVVGLLESMMTSTIIDELTETKSNRHRECKGQGLANIVSGLFGGMAGCAMIGQSVINVKSGGRGRLSTLIAGVMLLILVVFLSDLLAIIPMAALVAVMIMVSIGTFDWQSIRNLKRYPLSTNIVMVTTVAVVVYSHNLAYGVLVGVLLASLFFANKISHFMYVESEQDANGNGRRYRVKGQVFFNSTTRFIAAFNFNEAIDNVVIDLTEAHFWDVSAVKALDSVVLKFRRNGTQVDVTGLNEASATIVDRFGVHDKPDEIDRVIGGH